MQTPLSAGAGRRVTKCAARSRGLWLPNGAPAILAVEIAELPLGFQSITRHSISHEAVDG